MENVVPARQPLEAHPVARPVVQDVDIDVGQCLTDGHYEHLEEDLPGELALLRIGVHHQDILHPQEVRHERVAPGVVPRGALPVA